MAIKTSSAARRAFPSFRPGSKRRILSRNFAGELERLKETALTLAGRDLKTRDLGADTLRRAIIELITALDVYRTYVDIAGPSPRIASFWRARPLPPN